MRRILRLFAVCVASCLIARAAVISLTGNLDPADPNDVLLVELRVTASGALTVRSWGYAGGINASGAVIPGGGFDPYVTLFEGVGPSATYMASNDDRCAGLDESCKDSLLVLTGLAPGSYTVALTAFANMSFAENYGSGALVDGFVGMGSYFDWASGVDRGSAYALDISGDLADVPEPASLSYFCLAALVGLSWLRPHRSPR